MSDAGDGEMTKRRPVAGHKRRVRDRHGTDYRNRVGGLRQETVVLYRAAIQDWPSWLLQDEQEFGRQTNEDGHLSGRRNGMSRDTEVSRSGAHLQARSEGLALV